MKKRLFACLTALCILPSASCAGPPSAHPPAPTPDMAAPTWKSHTDPVTLTMTSQITGNTDADHAPIWGEDEISRLIMDLTGVKLDIRYQGDEQVDIPAQIAAGEITDLLCVATAEDAKLLENDGICYPLDELAAQYCPDFWDDVDPLQQLNNQAEDGHVYTLRSGYFSDAFYADPRIPLLPPWTLNFNKTLLDGRPLPTSIEDLEALLIALKQKTPPMAMADVILNPLPQWMGISCGLSWDPEARRVRTPFTDPGWLAYIQLMNRWYRAGLLAIPDADDEELINPYGFQTSWFNDALPHTLVLAATHRINRAGSLYQSTVTEDDPWPWIMLAEPLTYQGENRMVAWDHQATWSCDNHLLLSPANHGINAESALFIGRSCQQPDRAVLFMQFLKGQEWAQLTHWGIEGQHYIRDEEGLLIYQAPYQNNHRVLDELDSDYRNTMLQQSHVQYWDFMANDTVYGLLAGSPIAYQTNPTLLAIRQQRIEAGKVYKEYAARSKCPALQFALPGAGSDEGSVYRAVLDAWQAGVHSLILSSANEAAAAEGWQSLQRELSNMGLDALEASMTGRFAEALKRYHAAGYFTEIQP